MSYEDEYYCPNCGTILNDQYGFDPNNGTWTCTVCGKHLMDDDVYDGDNFEGVAWYCDNCNALLNRQYGFSDSYGTWTCTECGHTNGITEDDIINEDHFSCPNCGDTLNNQCCFNKYDDNWTCTSCGTHLHHNYSDDEYSIVDEFEDNKLKCPNCGDILSNQCFFNEYDNNWTCTSCGAKLHHNYSDDEYTIVIEDENDEETSTKTYYQSEHKQKESATSYKSSNTKNNVNFYCPNCGAMLSKQYGFDNTVDEYACKVCHTQLYHYYTDEPYKIKHIRTKATSTANNNSNNTTYSTHYSTSSKSTSKSNTWFMFFICLFLGFLGVHKFIEKKVGMGILYLCTAGLFYVGWIIDSIKYFNNAIK